jgi:hypothetical protein
MAIYNFCSNIVRLAKTIKNILSYQKNYSFFLEENKWNLFHAHIWNLFTNLSDKKYNYRRNIFLYTKMYFCLGLSQFPFFNNIVCGHRY